MKKIYSQKIIARNSEGKEYYGVLEQDGTFYISNLSVGEYEVFIDLSSLPEGYFCDTQKVFVLYGDSKLRVELHLEVPN